LAESYAVEAIMNHRLRGDGEYEYLVRWKHYSKDQDSWEPESCFDDEATIAEYWKNRGGATAGKVAAGRE
jgi:hypothetical protein